MKELIRRILREQTDELIRQATVLPQIESDEQIFYLPKDKKWEYTLIDNVWHTRKKESEDEWVSLGGKKYIETVRQLDKVLLNKGDWEKPKKTSKKTTTKKDLEKLGLSLPNLNPVMKGYCNFVIPVAWPTYEPKLEKGAGDFEVWGARVYAAIMNNDFSSKEGTYGKLGHGGVATIEQDGRVRFFEFGRYAGSDVGMGLTKSNDLGKIAKFTTSLDVKSNFCNISNLDDVVKAIKESSYGEGPKLPMIGHVVRIPNVKGAIKFADKKTQRKYKAIDLEIGDDEFNCGTFVYDVVKAGGLNMGSWCFPDPENMVDSFQNISLGSISA